MATYTDEGAIGSGGFGEVFRCRRKEDEKVFAKKRLHADAGTDAIARFAREVRILSSLDHPNIVRVVGKKLSSLPYFCILPLYKRSLRVDLGSLIGDEDRIYLIFSAILNAIEYAHSEGVIHRDLKPENILLNDDNDVVVADFGLGRILTASSTRQTETGFKMGTPLYMPPEQLRDAKSADQRSDIYSLGRMLYELYSGELLSAVQTTTRLPTGIAYLVNKCTRQEPDERFQSASELKGAWHGLFDGSLRGEELDELQSLIAELTTSDPGTLKSIERATELFTKYHEDPDLLHETIMRMPASVLAAMFAVDSEPVTSALCRFAKLASEQGWGFSYTDRIADTCDGIHGAISAPEVRAAMIDCVMHVGVNHNRWHVLGIFKKLIESPKEGCDALAICDVLGRATTSVKRAAAAHVELARLHPSLKDYFEFS